MNSKWRDALYDVGLVLWVIAMIFNISLTLSIVLQNTK